MVGLRVVVKKPCETHERGGRPTLPHTLLWSPPRRLRPPPSRPPHGAAPPLHLWPARATRATHSALPRAPHARSVSGRRADRDVRHPALPGGPAPAPGTDPASTSAAATHAAPRPGRQRPRTRSRASPRRGHPGRPYRTWGGRGRRGRRGRGGRAGAGRPRLRRRRRPRCWGGEGGGARRGGEGACFRRARFEASNLCPQSLKDNQGSQPTGRGGAGGRRGG